MEDSRTFKEKSLQTNIDNFIKELDDLTLYRLSNYLNSTFVDTPPDETQKRFINEFFGEDEWVNYIRDFYTKTGKYFVSTPKFNLAKIKEYVMFKISHRFIDLLVEHNKIDTELIKLKMDICDLKIKIGENNINKLKLKIGISEAFKNNPDDYEAMAEIINNE